MFVVLCGWMSGVRGDEEVDEWVRGGEGGRVGGCVGVGVVRDVLGLGVVDVEEEDSCGQTCVWGGRGMWMW